MDRKGAAIRRAALPLVAALLLGPPCRAAEPPGDYFEDARWGFKVRAPKDWRQASVAVDEIWIASKHLGKRELEAARTTFWAREEPEMWVVGFPHDRSPKQGYKEYIQGRSDFLSWDEGYEFSREEETRVGDVPVTVYEITRPKDSEQAPRRVLAWVYHFDDIDFAVQFKILAEHFDGYESSFTGCLRSFRRIPRTRELPGTVAAAPAAAAAPRTPEEEERARKDAVKQRIRREIDALQQGWKSREEGPFLVLYNADEQFVRATAAHAAVVLDHVQKLLGPRSGYAPPVILRIFASEGERDAYSAGAGDDGLVGQILVAAGHGWEKDRAYETLNRGIFAEWLESRDAGAPQVLPAWLETGIQKYMDMVRTKGKRITFSNEDWDRDSMRLAIKRGEYVPLKELVLEGQDSLERPGFHAQARSVGFWLLTKGDRGRSKGLVRNLLAHLIDGARAAGAEAGSKKAEIRQAASDRAFEGWTDQDWQKLTNAWLDHAK